MCFAQRSSNELRQENPCFTITGTQLGSRPSDRGCSEVQARCRRTGRLIQDSHPGMMETAWAMAGVQRYRDNADGWSYREFMLGRLWGREFAA